VKPTNITIDKENKKISLKLNKSFYPKDNILKTAEKFFDACWIDVVDSGDYFILNFKPKVSNVELDILGYEFSSHLLASIKEEIGEF